MYCIWHVKNNVLEHAQKAWRVNGVDDEEREINTMLRDEFMSRWRDLVYA
jgi:hypothetical protein